MASELYKRIRRRVWGAKVSHVRQARIWSNHLILKIGKLAVGDVVNVSAWHDEDKEGSRYREYFPLARSYTTTNYDGWRGIEGATDIELDLVAPLPREYKGAFDFVLNHTTLEHIFEVDTAFANLCSMSRNAVLVVVPFIQGVHGPENGDFWRFTPYAVRNLFEKNGFRVVFESAGPVNGRVRYLACLGARDPAQWGSLLQGWRSDALEMLGESNGSW